jgi:hypothetical protein
MASPQGREGLYSPPSESGKQSASAETPPSQTLKFSKKRLALAFAIAGISAPKFEQH